MSGCTKRSSFSSVAAKSAVRWRLASKGLVLGEDGMYDQVLGHQDEQAAPPDFLVAKWNNHDEA
jgi:hypothetical protein